ncbi:uncharacterized protein AB675_7268 [Cyphellophora attinorum]|uniref:Uncharacterized protein n=1 Tax=Cyphellophora attinorum TaxID=1664694 RepID=A0A0N1H3K9_9EURO|nr:uncharacterized protein AB675_7268 [Phialophora attinorum]KPI36266.1 hypothetical protein AB675_7268 [Phialophora attinorum]
MAQSETDPASKKSSHVQKVATTFMTLPTEVLEIILKEAFRDPCLQTRLVESFNTLSVRIALPQAILVSRDYFKVAKQAALQEGSVCLAGIPRRFWHMNVRPKTSHPKMTVSPDFHQIQHLTLQKIESDMSPYSTKNLKAIVKAAPRLRRLVVQPKFKIWLMYEDMSPNSVELDRDAVDEEMSIPLNDTRSDYIKRKFEKRIDKWPTSYDNMDWHYLAVALLAWTTRNKTFEVSLEVNVNDLVDEWHLWTVKSSTRTHALAIVPGRNNIKYAENGEPEKIIAMSSSLFDDMCNSQAGQKRLRRTRAA